MTSNDVSSQLEHIAEAVVEQLGLALVDVAIGQHKGRVKIVVAVDKPGGVTIDDCQEVSRAIARQIDQITTLGDYSLEVESPGVGRRLRSDREFKYYVGHEIEAKTYSPIDGRRHFVGKLLGIVDGKVIIAGDDGRDVRIPRDQLANARLVVRF